MSKLIISLAANTGKPVKDALAGDEGAALHVVAIMNKMAKAFVRDADFLKKAISAGNLKTTGVKIIEDYEDVLKHWYD